jgi:hypothetical protein
MIVQAEDGCERRSGKVDGAEAVLLLCPGWRRHQYECEEKKTKFFHVVLQE